MKSADIPIKLSHHLDLVSNYPHDATLSAAYGEVSGQTKRDSNARAIQFREALAMAEKHRQSGNNQGAWLHLRMAEKILTSIAPEIISPQSTGTFPLD